VTIGSKAPVPIQEPIHYDVAKSFMLEPVLFAFSGSPVKTGEEESVRKTDFVQ
jgi:deoxyribodipyrimidine photolyase